MKPKVITFSTSSASNPSSPTNTPGSWAHPRPAGDRGKFRQEQYYLDADDKLVTELTQLLGSANVHCSWQEGIMAEEPSN